MMLLNWNALFKRFSYSGLQNISKSVSYSPTNYLPQRQRKFLHYAYVEENQVSYSRSIKQKLIA